MKKNVGAQLVKSLCFEVEAIPQDNAIEVKNTSNMTPLNVKVRVRKKDDGPSFVRKGIIAVPRIDQPDSPIERLRLASSDQTIMSFNMLMEADLEKKVTKKSKRNFFGICLGVKDDDDDSQYLPSEANLSKDTKSDTGVVKLSNDRPITKSVVIDDTTSSYSAKKNDKLFGKCKPGGCLDPPFGEDRYAYQPQPLRCKAPATKIDHTEDVELQEQTSDSFPGTLKLSSKKKKGVEAAAVVNQDDNKDKSILSLYQGEQSTAVEDNDSEFIITYPPALSSSGLLLADEKNEKNVTGRASGGRHSKKSFNEFSTEYFSPPRTPRDSKDSSKSEKEKQTLTKAILAPGQTKSVSPNGFRRNIGNADSKGFRILGTADKTKMEPESKEQCGSNVSIGVTFTPDDILLKKAILRTTSQGITSELLKDLENISDRKSWDHCVDASRLVSAETVPTGIVGVKIAGGAKTYIQKPEEQNQETSPIQGFLTDTNMPQSNSSYTNKDHHSEYIARMNTGDTKINTGIDLGITPLRRATAQTSEKQTGTESLRSSLTQITPTEDSAKVKNSERDLISKRRTANESNEDNLKSGGIAKPEVLDSSLSQKRPQVYKDIDDKLVTARMGMTEYTKIGNLPIESNVQIYRGSDKRLSETRSPTSEDIDKNATPKEVLRNEDSAREYSPVKELQEKNSIDRQEIASTGITVNTRSENINSYTGKLIYNNTDIELGLKGTTLSVSSKSGSQHTQKGSYEGTLGDYTSKQLAMTVGAAKSNLQTVIATNDMTIQEPASKGIVEATGKAVRRAISDNFEREPISKGKALTSGSDRGFLPAGVEHNTGSDLASSGVSGASDKGFSFIEITNTEGDFAVNRINSSERDFSPSELGMNDGYSGENPFIETKSITSATKGLLHTDMSTSIPAKPVYADFLTEITEDSRSWNRAIFGGSENDISQMREHRVDKRDTTTNNWKNLRKENNFDAAWPEQRDASVSSDIIKSPSDIIKLYREKKPLAKSPVVGVDIQPTDVILEQAGRKLDDWGSSTTKEGQFPSSVGIISNDSDGRDRDYVESLPGTKYESHDKYYDYDAKNGLGYVNTLDRHSTEKNKKAQSRESIFLNLAFQTYSHENQASVRTLDSSKNQDTNNVVFVKSLLRCQDKSGISVPISAKHVMNIEIKPAPAVQERKARIPKPITKFDSGKSDFSNSTISLKNIGSDPHVALSLILQQELIPLESIIKSLKDDIDSLAAQQMLLKDRLGPGPQRNRPAYNRKCGCLKRTFS